MTDLRSALLRILRDYPDARYEPFKGHPLASFVRTDARQATFNALDAPAPTIVTRASPGRSAWATVPWIAVFDTTVTRSATRGFYVVYLFSADMRRLYLSLIVGTVSIRQRHGDGATDVLRDRAWLLAQRAEELGYPLPRAPIDLASDAGLPRDYEAAHAAGYAYEADALPAADALTADLNRVAGAYAALVEASGLMPTGEPPAARSTR